MKTSADARIDAYIKKSALFAQPILNHLRKLVHQGCPTVVETLKWGAPHFEHAGKILAGMAAFKAHATFGFWHQGMTEIVAQDRPDAGEAMGQFGRLTSVDDLPGDKIMVRYVQQATKLNESNVPSRPRPTATGKKELAVPADLSAALRKNKAAAATFEKFSPSHRKEYIQWITEAKRAATRQQRLATTLEWLAEGKPRNWKYMNC